MNAKRIVLALSVAFVVSGLSCWVVSRRVAVAAAPAKIPDAMYVIAARDVQPGQVLKPEDVQLTSWPGDHPMAGAQIRIASVLGREVLFPLAKGEPLLERHLSAPGSGTGLASKIPDGMRAVTLRSDEVVAVAGFLIPGSHLDVLVTYRTIESPEPLTATVLQNVVAIAAGHEIQPDPAGKPSDVTVVTLLLNPDDVQRAVLASGQGQIHFVLRNGSDQTTGGTTPVTLSQLSGRPIHTAVRTPKVTASTEPVRHEVEMILGGQAANAGAGR
jgi:pilus assembly protein CpaB